MSPNEKRKEKYIYDYNIYINESLFKNKSKSDGENRDVTLNKKNNIRIVF